jgi:hypothetical protein
MQPLSEAMFFGWGLWCWSRFSEPLPWAASSHVVGNPGAWQVKNLSEPQLRSFTASMKTEVLASWGKAPRIMCCWSSTHLRSLHWKWIVFWCVLMYFVKRQSGTIHICCACLLLGCSMCFVHSDVRIVHLPQKFFGNAAQMDSHGIELWGKARRVRFWNCSVFLLSNAH